MAVIDKNKEELYYIAGDQDHGMSSDIRFDNFSDKVDVRYDDFVLTCDVYPIGDEITIVLICPKCRHTLRISSKDKQISWDGKKLNVEPFECTWEMGAERQQFGLSLCRWRVGISNNYARNA